MKDDAMGTVSFSSFLSYLDLVSCYLQGEIADLREFTLSLTIELALDKYRHNPEDLAPVFAIIPAISMPNHGQVWNSN